MAIEHRHENEINQYLLFKLSNIAGVIPWYDFKKQKLSYESLYKLYGILLAVFVLVTTLICFYNIRQDVAFNSPLLNGLKVLGEATSLLLFLLIVSGSSFWNMKSWEQFINLLPHTDCRLKCNRKYFLNIPFVAAIAGCIHPFIVYGFALEAGEIILAQHMLVIHFTRHIMICLMYHVISLLRNMYDTVNKSLVRIKLCAVINSSTIEDLQELQTIYVEADKIVCTFNIVFGWPLLLLFTQTVASMLLILSTFTENGLNIRLKEILTEKIILMTLFHTVAMVCGPVVITFSCDAVVNKANMLLKMCSKLCEDLPLLVREKEELARLHDIIQSKKPKFSVLSLFEIRRSTLLSLISVTTTYMIVILQYNYL
ncbi:uncharacterized protein LOC108908597 [Anoplophora glabripennis]|uniref:uncharacterized protein LOC108908597 n=1 Tax=Anoplophora glabripennis TaxID=217634 RepID=UPI000873FDC2|nr:uncharacterized protein LOC108908597 [Anoplophora glabripennis]